MKKFQITITAHDCTFGAIHATFTVKAENRTQAVKALRTNSAYRPLYAEMRVRMEHAYAVQFSVKPIRA